MFENLKVRFFNAVIKYRYDLLSIFQLFNYKHPKMVITESKDINVKTFHISYLGKGLYHSLLQQIFSAYCVLGTVLGTRNTAMNKINKDPCLPGSLHSSTGVLGWGEGNLTK